MKVGWLFLWPQIFGWLAAAEETTDRVPLATAGNGLENTRLLATGIFAARQCQAKEAFAVSVR